jgi:hypothetical protein
MKRFLLFVILAPAFWLALVLSLILMVLDGANEPIRIDLAALARVVPAMLAVGAPPLALAGLFDALLARTAVPWRWVWVAIVAFGASLVVLNLPIVQSFTGTLSASVGLAAAMPAALCSWLAKDRSADAH